jgi:hypothetical protein
MPLVSDPKSKRRHQRIGGIRSQLGSKQNNLVSRCCERATNGVWNAMIDKKLDTAPQSKLCGTRFLELFFMQ